MRLRHKIILFAIAPLLISVATIAVAVFHQSNQLARLQRSTTEQAYLASKETELRHYVALGVAAISHLYESGRSDPATQQAALAILEKLSFGDDGYFYVYDMSGKNLMHPRQTGLVGRNLWDLTDAHGNRTIQQLIAKAKAGGGAVRYVWEKPSSHKIAPKLGYVVALERWGWMLGTGIYLDDVENALNKIDAQVAGNSQHTLFLIASIAIVSALLLATSGLALNISESRVAETKLKALAQSIVKSQEEERARLSRDLHDGLSQLLVSVKLQIESGLIKLDTAQAAPTGAARPAFARAIAQLNTALSELRRISHDLRPAMLDDLGLAAALAQLSDEFSTDSGLPVKFSANGNVAVLSPIGNTVLFRVAQEALTNIHKHAGKVSQVKIELWGNPGGVQLFISDNGSGFDVQGIADHPKRGIGLSNMKERLASVRGHLEVRSTPAGTDVCAFIPVWSE